MDNNFSFFTFSVFIGCSFQEFSEAIKKNAFYSELLEKKNAFLEPNYSLDLHEYINPERGFVLERFTWWTSMLYPNMVFLSSNLCDGLQTGCHYLQKELNCECINFSVSSSKGLYQKNHFGYISADGKERIVMAIKEEKWTFFQDGEPLPFENIELYKNKRIKDRINFAVINEYLMKLGIEFCQIDASIENCAKAVINIKTR